MLHCHDMISIGDEVCAGAPHSGRQSLFSTAADGSIKRLLDHLARHHQLIINTTADFSLDQYACLGSATRTDAARWWCCRSLGSPHPRIRAPTPAASRSLCPSGSSAVPAHFSSATSIRSVISTTNLRRLLMAAPIRGSHGTVFSSTSSPSGSLPASVCACLLQHQAGQLVSVCRVAHSAAAGIKRWRMQTAAMVCCPTYGGRVCGHCLLVGCLQHQARFQGYMSLLRTSCTRRSRPPMYCYLTVWVSNCPRWRLLGDQARLYFLIQTNLPNQQLREHHGVFVRHQSMRMHACMLR